MRHRSNYLKFQAWFLASWIIVGTIFAQNFRTVKPETVGMSSKRLDLLTQQLDAYVSDKQLSGGVALVLRKGKAAYFHAFGHRDVTTQDQMKKDDIFRIASQSKALISVGIMILQERGQLLIQDTVDKYIPAFNQTTVAEVSPKDGYNIVDSRRKM